LPSSSVYKLRIRTDSADSHALLLLDDGELIAILVELADESHGDERGRWIVEATFGVRFDRRQSGSFACAADAADWVSKHNSTDPFLLDGHIVDLG
jgi:hypothetical protein